MRNLAKRIEKATCDYFLDHEESNNGFAPQTWDDREKIWNRIQELKAEKDYHAARKQAITEFIFNVLEEYCVLTGKPEEVKEPEAVLVATDDYEDLEADMDRVDNDVEKLETDLSNIKGCRMPGCRREELKTDLVKLEKDVKQVKEDLRKRHRPISDLPEESLD